MDSLNKYEIRKGHHRSGVFFDLRLFDYNLNFDFLFEENCYFQPIEEDDFDINKLYGFSYGLHHKDSIRLGWRPSKNEGKIEVFIYYYNNGKRDWKYLSDVGTDRVYNCSIELFNDSFIVKINDSLGNNMSSELIDFQFPKIKWGYYLFPYFGGNKTAPKDMAIWVRRNKYIETQMPLMV